MLLPEQLVPFKCINEGLGVATSFAVLEVCIACSFSIHVLIYYSQCLSLLEASPALSSNAPPPPGCTHNQVPALITSPPTPLDATSQRKKTFMENDIDPVKHQNLSNRDISQTLRQMNCLQSSIISNPTSVSTSSSRFVTLGVFIPSRWAKDGPTSKKSGPWSKKHGS